MKNDIIIAGVGGQGILTISAIVGYAAMKAGLNIKQSEVHGMAQRGGAVLAHLRISDQKIYSDTIQEGEADVILSVEPMEALRYISYLKKDGVLLTNQNPVKNIDDYPNLEELKNSLTTYPRSLVIDADSIAKEAGTARAMNMVMLGCLTPFLAIPFETIQQAITDFFARKGEKVVEINLKALTAGREMAKKI